jgi:ubiquinone/menaquinone biosynthesis C-methylase UbiE
MKPADIGAVFDSTEADFARLAPHLWDPFGRATVEAVGIRPGDRVLDVCCGAGGSALPAAVATGPAGSVDAIDLAGTLLRQGRRRAEAQGLVNVRFIQADATAWKPPDGERYDVTVCVHGIFMLPDMDATAARLARLLRPGGRFTVTTWAGGALENFGIALADAVARERGTPPVAPAQRDAVTKIASEAGLRGWLAGLGLTGVTVTRVPMTLPLTEDLAWLLVLGSGFRGILHGLSPGATARVRDTLLALLREREIGAADTTTLIGAGTTRR